MNYIWLASNAAALFPSTRGEGNKAAALEANIWLA